MSAAMWKLRNQGQIVGRACTYNYSSFGNKVSAFHLQSVIIFFTVRPSSCRHDSVMDKMMIISGAESCVISSRRAHQATFIPSQGTRDWIWHVLCCLGKGECPKKKSTPAGGERARGAMEASSLTLRLIKSQLGKTLHHFLTVFSSNKLRHSNLTMVSWCSFYLGEACWKDCLTVHRVFIILSSYILFMPFWHGNRRRQQHRYGNILTVCVFIPTWWIWYSKQVNGL